MAFQKLHFIIIDDSKLDCFITEKIIQNTALSASIRSFVEATKALEFIKNELYPTDGFKTVIIVDIYMPLMNGFEFIEEFEKLPPAITENYFICMLSSSINENDINRIANYKSVKQFLNKPLKSNILTALLNPE
jgi:response regulator RpfG family c-di-GMP phosphodiesterase